MSNLAVVFYTEAGSNRGMGHLVRCYTIFEYFKEQGIKCTFFVDSDINFDYKFNDLNYFSWKNISSDIKYDIAFIDSYEIELDIYEKISLFVKKAIFLDDYVRLDYPSGVILNFLPDANKMYKREKKHNYLLGLDYIPIRKEFIINQKSYKKEQIFIMMGGMDLSNITEDIVHTLKIMNMDKVIVTKNKEVFNQLEKIENTKVLYKPTDSELSSSMAKSTMAISTASMTLYELAYFSVPTIIVATSKNQEIGAVQLIKNGLAYDLLDMKEISWRKTLLEVINKLLDLNPTINNVIDGKGTQRILNETLRLIEN